jgi:uncharacterized protein (TIGR02466 family)
VEVVFATPVIKYNIARNFTDVEISKINDILKELRPNTNNLTTVDDMVLEHKEMSDIKKFCVDKMYLFATETLNIVDTEFRITQSWLNISKKGQSHPRHTHLNSVFSGVFYLNVSPGDQLVFHRLRDPNSFSFPKSAENDYTRLQQEVFVENGDLLLFPSWMEHSVPLTNSDKRISLAFNSFPIGSFGLRGGLAYYNAEIEDKH